MKKKIISLSLSLIIMCNSSIVPFAQPKLNYRCFDTKYKILEEQNGVYLVENIEINGKKYVFTHSKKDSKNIIDISGAENEHLEFDISGELIKSSTPTVFMSTSSYWQHFGPTSYTISWKEGASVALIAAALAGAVHGPVGIFLGAASALAGVSIGCRIEYYGKYKLEGSHVRGEYTAEIYHNDEHIYTTNWSGYR